VQKSFSLNLGNIERLVNAISDRVKEEKGGAKAPSLKALRSLVAEICDKTKRPPHSLLSLGSSSSTLGLVAAPAGSAAPSAGWENARESTKPATATSASSASVGWKLKPAWEAYAGMDPVAAKSRYLSDAPILVSIQVRQEVGVGAAEVNFPAVSKPMEVEGEEGGEEEAKNM